MAIRSLPRRRLVAAGLAIVLVIAGVLVAVLGGGGRGKLGSSPSGRRAVARTQVAGAAGYLGVSTAQLSGELRSGRSLAEVAAKKGRSPQGLVEALLAERATRLNARRGLTTAQRQHLLSLERAHLEVAVARHGPPVVIAGSNLRTAAMYLGVDPLTLRGELRKGRTLAQIADSTPRRSSSGLVAALVAGRKVALRSAVAAGRITSAQEARLLASMRTRMTTFVNRTLHG